MLFISRFRFWAFLILGTWATAACDDERPFNDGPFESKRTAVLSFVFGSLSPPVAGAILPDDSLVTAVLPFGTDLTALAPTIVVSPGATVAPAGGIPNDFTDTTTYLVTSENGTVQRWRVVVSLSEPDAQPKLQLSAPVWNLSPAGTGVPGFFTTDGERGLAYGNNHLYVTSNNDKVLVIDPDNGTQIGSLDMTGIEGGSPKIADVEVSDNGAILACNSVEWTSDGGGPPTTFKIYKWDNETSAPVVWLTYQNTQYRMGDSFSVVGDISGDAVVLTAFGRKFLNPTNRGNLVLKWTVTGGVVNPEPELITVQGVPTLTKFGSRPHAQLLSPDNDSLYINGNDIDFTLTDGAGSFVARIPNSGRQLYNGFTSYFEVFEFAGKRVLASAFPRSSVESRLLIVDITRGLGQATTDDVLLSQNFMTGEIANINGSGAVAIHRVDNNNVEVYCLITNQALVRFNLTTVL